MVIGGMKSLNGSLLLLMLHHIYRIFPAIRQGFSPSRMTSNNLISPMKFCYNTNSTLPKQCQSSRSVLQDGSRTFGLFWKEKTLSYNRRNTVVLNTSDFCSVTNIFHVNVPIFLSGGKIRGKVIGTTLGRIQYTSFSPSNSLVAACTGFYIVILLTQVM